MDLLAGYCQVQKTKIALNLHLTQFVGLKSRLLTYFATGGNYFVGAGLGTVLLTTAFVTTGLMGVSLNLP